MPGRQQDLLAAARALEAFAGTRLTSRISELEASFVGSGVVDAQGLLSSAEVSHDLFAAANLLKRVAGQIHVVIHTVGILLCLPHILEPSEHVEYLSLGAGNTGRSFDLETNLRVAEFKFINWHGGSETIRQNALFKDLYLLAEDPTPKRKFMYVLETEHPLKFLLGGRSLNSVMSRNRKLWDEFQDRYGAQFSTVRDYYDSRSAQVALVGISQFLEERATE